MNKMSGEGFLENLKETINGLRERKRYTKQQFEDMRVKPVSQRLKDGGPMRKAVRGFLDDRSSIIEKLKQK